MRHQRQMAGEEAQGPPVLLRTVHEQQGCQMGGDYQGRSGPNLRWRRMTQQMESRHAGEWGEDDDG